MTHTNVTLLSKVATHLLKSNGPSESSNPFALQKPKVTPGVTIQRYGK
jgi:hypothetical protein